MVRPVRFGYNEQTAESNAFQTNDTSRSSAQIQAAAAAEFDTFVAMLREKGVQVTVIEDTVEPHTPDSIFPNNWISFHEDQLFIYPMYAPNRRLERREDIVAQLGAGRKIIDFSPNEHTNRMLEGTGSMVLDRANRVAYACLSPRTEATLFAEFCAAAGYRPVAFTSVDEHGKEVYHTNVMMAIGARVAVVCFDSIADAAERAAVQAALAETGHECVALSFAQMNQFAGNMLAVSGSDNVEYLVMSKRAWDSLDAAQRATIERLSTPLVIPIDVIETYGGGSVRCMMAEVFA